MQPPSIVIAANPYEAELCRRALVETGLRVVVAEGGEGALDVVRAEKPLVLVIALGIFGVEPLELLRAARQELPRLPIFLLGDRNGELPDEDAAARVGATRLFLRPIEVDALADAIEKRAVEAEVAEDVAEAMRDFDVSPETIDAEPLVEEAIVEMEADYGDEDEEAPPRALAKIALKRVPTEVMNGVIDVRASEPHVEASVASVEATLEMEADEPTPEPQPPPERPPPMDHAPPATIAVEPLLRADDALADVGLQQLAVAPDFVVEQARDERPARLPEAVKRGEPAERARPAFDERSTFSRRLESELSAAERRLFPDSPSTVNATRDEYEDALGDIDLDAVGIDTIPGVSNDWADTLDAAFELKPRNGQIHGSGAADAPPPAPSRPLAGGAARPFATLPEDEGDLGATDVATLVASLHAAGFSGAVTLERGDGDKTIYFDAGTPVAARSTFAHDRLPDLLLREGLITREQHARARDLPQAGRGVAHKLVELGFLKSSELFSTLRRHAEDIFFSCFGWERGRYRLSADEPKAEERVRPSAHPWALVTEGVRRKYSLERLVELVGPPETVLTPTTLLARALDEGGFSAAERARAELIDGERSLTELSLGAGGMALGEPELYALAWSLVAIGAARIGAEGDAAAGAGVRGVPTLVTAPYGAAGGSAARDASERRTRARAKDRARDRDADRAIDKERVLAKRAQVQEGDYFAILGLGRDASAREVARAFERLKREFSAERFADPLRQELSDALVEIGEVLDEAHRVLADDELRASYRAHLIDVGPDLGSDIG